MRPFNVLAVLGETDPCGAGMLSVLKAHFTLVCRSSREALISVPQFASDVVLIDWAVSDGPALLNRLSEANAAGEKVFVALTPPDTNEEVPATIRHRLTSPATARDLEDLFEQINEELTADFPADSARM